MGPTSQKQNKKTFLNYRIDFNTTQQITNRAQFDKIVILPIIPTNKPLLTSQKQNKKRKHF